MSKSATTERRKPQLPFRLSRRALVAGGFAVLPAALTAYMSFQGGGFFAGTPALLAMVLAVVLVLRITLAERPFEGFNAPLAVAAGALGAYAVWILASSFWSDAPARALVDFNRALLYWFALVLFGSLAGRQGRVAVAVRLLVLAITVVCGVALVSRLFPNLLDVAPEVARRRLSYPLTYWNALGMMAAIGIVFSSHLTASEQEPRTMRVAGAAALPILACTLYFTFSRGAMLAGLIGLFSYVVLTRPRGLPSALLAAGPAVAVALVASYRADLLAGWTPTSSAAADQGHDVAIVVAICVIAAALLRALLLGLDVRLQRLSISGATRRRARMALVAAICVAAGAVFVAFDGSDRLSEVAHGFSDRGTPGSEDRRSRLVDPRNNGRIEQWQAAIDAFSSAPIVGIGAGKFTAFWLREREVTLKVEDAHSLYLESMAELGLVGLALILTVLGCVMTILVLRARSRTRHIYVAVLAAVLVWALHAGVDWDWEMSAITLWVFALGGMALAAPASAAVRSPARITRVATGIGCLALAVPACLMAVSQRQLNTSVDALKRGECRLAIAPALASARAVPVRPEPFQLLGFCDVRLGRADLAVNMLEAAVERDPESWEAHYGLALVRGAAGRDPRPAAAKALALNPREPLTRDAVRFFDTGDPQKWRRRALSARLPI